MNIIISRRLKSFLLLTLATSLLWGCGSSDKTVELTATQEQQVAERIAPEGHVSMAGQVAATSLTSAAGAAQISMQPTVLPVIALVLPAHQFLVMLPTGLPVWVRVWKRFIPMRSLVLALCLHAVPAWTVAMTK